METVRHQHWLPFYDTAGGCIDFDDDVDKPPGFSQILTTENNERFYCSPTLSCLDVSMLFNGGIAEDGEEFYACLRVAASAKAGV